MLELSLAPPGSSKVLSWLSWLLLALPGSSWLLLALLALPGSRSLGTTGRMKAFTEFPKASWLLYYRPSVFLGSEGGQGALALGPLVLVNP